MTSKKFMELAREAAFRCMAILGEKEKEYSQNNEDRLAFFKRAGTDDGVSPEEALWGMLRKQLTSLGMMCRPAALIPKGVWEEKLTDAHNYLFLLEGLIKERSEKGEGDGR
jgi:hypothetical protein